MSSEFEGRRWEREPRLGNGDLGPGPAYRGGGGNGGGEPGAGGGSWDGGGTGPGGGGVTEGEAGTFEVGGGGTAPPGDFFRRISTRATIATTATAPTTAAMRMRSDSEKPEGAPVPLFGGEDFAETVMCEAPFWVIPARSAVTVTVTAPVVDPGMKVTVAPVEEFNPPRELFRLQE